MMFFTKKSLIFLLVFIVIISVAANVYSFSKRSDVSNDLKAKVIKYENEFKQKDKTIDDLKSQISSLEKMNTRADSEDANTENQNKTVDVPGTPEDKIIHTAYRFIEYAFDSNSDTYVERKKMARDYMTDNLFDTLYSADGIDENKQNIKTEVERINVYLSAENDDEVIVYYVLNEEIPSTGYKETIEKYVTLKFVSEDNHFKVSSINSINNEDGGI